jgi:tetratricopeptide (TPR) repeat protein
VSHAGHIVTKDALIEAAWQGVAVTDNSLEQVISSLRRTLGDASPAGATAYIETLARRGYRFAAPVTTSTSRVGDDELAALLWPYRTLVTGRAALETFDRDAVASACDAFERVTREAPDYAAGHLGLANALALAMESTRAETEPDAATLTRALQHASDACRLDPASGEAWATLSLLSHQARQHHNAIAAAQRAAALEPDNWRHLLRLAYVSWGEARLRAADRVLKLVPDFPLAHWMTATVHVARHAFDQAERVLMAGVAAQERQHADAPFRGVGLHLLLGLILLARRDEEGAIRAFERELASEGSRHIYAREACANTWCAMAAVSCRRGDISSARSALTRATSVIASHPVAMSVSAALPFAAADERTRVDTRLTALRGQGAVVEAAVAEAVGVAVRGDHAAASRSVHTALLSAPPGSAGWTIPVEPFLDVHAQRGTWDHVLTLLSGRAC